MPLPKQVSKPKSSLSDYSMLLYGPTKIGKTTLASKFPDAVFLATEEGQNEVEVYKDTVLSWEAFTQDFLELYKGNHNFKTVVIDTIDNLYKFCSEHVCKKLNITHESDLGYGKGFSMVNNEFQRFINRLSLLPYGLVLISHSHEKEVDTRTGKIKKIVPTLPDAARKIVVGMVDLVLYCDFEQIRDKDNKVTEIKRVIRTRPTLYYEAGSRIQNLPEVIDLDYDKFIAAFNKAKGIKS